MTKYYRNCRLSLLDSKIDSYVTKNPNALIHGIPLVFSEDQIDDLPLSATNKQRLRSLKEGSILKLGMISNAYRQVIRIDPYYNPEKIAALENEKKQLNDEIRELVGDKMKRLEEIRNELRILNS